MLKSKFKKIAVWNPLYRWLCLLLTGRLYRIKRLKVILGKQRENTKLSYRPTLINTK